LSITTKLKKNPTKPYNTMCKVWTSVDNVLLHSYHHPVQYIDSQMHYTTDEWIKKMWYLYRMEFYSVMKKNEILSFAGKWMELENIILSEVNQAQKTKYHMFSLICRL
jgi:hypothetical protein